VKRAFDIVVVTLTAPLWTPIIALVALAVRSRLGTPVLFTQVRPGLHAAPFTMFKFRTMTEARNAAGDLLPDGMRLTPLGRWLRATSLDELPELWNVLKGDMSLVGPRPLLMDYLPLYTDAQARRHELRPGITGWAQVSGRNAISWEEKFRCDVWYIDHQSIWLDVRILAMTIVRVFQRQGISREGEATMPRFTGRPD